MSEKIRKLKEEASRLIAKGKLAEAADEYIKIVKSDPRDLTARQKLAELFARMGKIPEAVAEYQSVAGSYAADGLLLKAIAVCKIILQIDPAHKETQHVLADLSTKKRGESSAVAMPKAMSAALPSGKKSAADIRGAPASHVKPRTKDLEMPQVVPDGTLSRPIPLPAQPAAPPRPPAPPPSSMEGAPIADAPSSSSPSASEISAAAARALMEAFDAAPIAPLPTPTGPAPRGAVDDISLDISFDANSNEGAPVIVGESALEAPSAGGAPVSMVSASGIDLSNMPGDDMSDMPSVVGVSASQEGAAVMAAPDLPVDEEAILDESADDGSDIIELTEPAKVEIDKVPPIPLFSDLPQAAFIALTERMELRVAAKDDYLVQEGERGSSMFIIIQGRVVVKRKALDGDTTVAEGGDIILAELSDGAFFGEMALLSDAPRMASVQCADDTMLFEISRDLLADITREYPSVGEVMKRFHKNRLLTNLLKTSPIFQPFSTKDKKDLIEKFKSRSVEEGVFLITRERPGEGLYVLLSGRCEVYDQNAEGKDVLLAELKEGDVFGEMSMLWHKKTCASVKASTPCVVLRLPKESFTEVIMTHPQILETLTALSERRAKANKELQTPDVVSDFLV